MNDRTLLVKAAAVFFGLFLSVVGASGENARDPLVDELGKTERARGGLGRFYVLGSEVTREVISKGPEIIPSLLDLAAKSDDPRQLASVVYCLRELKCWSACNLVREVDERIDQIIKEAAEGTNIVSKTNPPSLTFDSSAMNRAILSNEIRMFLRDAEEAQPLR